jgi:tetratricopeptide (TPR) repeat protein
MGPRAAKIEDEMSRLLISCLLALPLIAAKPGYDPINSKGFQHFYNLEYDPALAEFENEIAQNPAWPDAYNHLAQAIQFRELYRVGALESELVSGNNSFLRRPKVDTTAAVEERFMAAIARSMALSQEMLNRNPKDTTAMYSLGVAYGLRANWNFLVRKKWMDSLKDATQGRKLHNHITEIDPSNYDARLMQGAHDYVVGSLPFFYRMLGFLAGFHGDKDQGIRTLNEVAQKGHWNKVDARVLLCALYRREQQWKDAEPLLDDLTRRFPRNYLFWFEKAQLYSSLGDKARAIGAIDHVKKMRLSGMLKDVSDAKLAYQYGNIQFWYRDYEPALANMQKVAMNAQDVDLNTGALAMLRIGQIYDLTNRRGLAMQAYKRAIEFAPEAEAAKDSKHYLSTPYQRKKQG